MVVSDQRNEKTILPKYILTYLIHPIPLESLVQEGKGGGT